MYFIRTCSLQLLVCSILCVSLVRVFDSVIQVFYIMYHFFFLFNSSISNWKGGDKISNSGYEFVYFSLYFCQVLVYVFEVLYPLQLNLDLLYGSKLFIIIKCPLLSLLILLVLKSILVDVTVATPVFFFYDMCFHSFSFSFLEFQPISVSVFQVYVL